MKRRLLQAGLILGLVLAGTQAIAGGFMLGEETKGVTFTSNESDLTVRIRVQPRLDYGDIIKSRDNTTYENDKDLYIRRARLELTGHLLSKTVRYNLTLSGDKWDKTGNTNEVLVHQAFVEWTADEKAAFVVGKENLPYSRISLSSSSRQLLVEKPVSTEAAKKLFGKTDPYYQPKIGVRGKFLDGAVSYDVAVADGWQNGEAIQTGRTVYKANPFFAARVELSPPGWVEGKKSDAHLGKGRHLAFGADIADQGNIEYKENGFKERRTLAGFDISGHYQGITGQFEYNQWRSDSEDPAIGRTRPKGWYAQAGYFIDGINLEPAVRYEVYDQDSNSKDKKEFDTTVGVNWYAKGHSLKVGLNWLHARYQGAATGRLSNDDSKDIYQLQGQIYF